MIKVSNLWSGDKEHQRKGLGFWYIGGSAGWWWGSQGENRSGGRCKTSLEIIPEEAHPIKEPQVSKTALINQWQENENGSRWISWSGDQRVDENSTSVATVGTLTKKAAGGGGLFILILGIMKLQERLSINQLLNVSCTSPNTRRHIFSLL